MAISWQDLERTKRIFADHGRIKALVAAKTAGVPPPGRVRESNGKWMVRIVRGYRSKDDQEASVTPTFNSSVRKI